MRMQKLLKNSNSKKTLTPLNRKEKNSVVNNGATLLKKLGDCILGILYFQFVKFF